MQIRRAEPEDALQLAPLLLASAKHILSLTFEHNAQHSALGYLRHSLSKQHGQYGYHPHWLMVDQRQIVGCVTAWHSAMPKAFHQGTLDSVLEYFTAEQLADVITINRVLQTCIPNIKDNELCIGHLSVENKHRRKGIASQLIDHMCEHAKKMDKPYLSIDVEGSNDTAIKFYQNMGFNLVSKTKLTEDMQTLGIEPFWHFVKHI